MEAIGQSKDVREVLTQDLDEDLRHHLLHQRATDRTTWLHYPPQRAQQYRQCLQRSRRARLRRAACRGLARTFLDWFERTSVGYNAATRSNTGKGTWQCQHFKPGQVHLIGRKSYLADLGWPRHARNLGPTMLAGVPVWHVRATVFGGPPQGGGAEPPTRADFYIARSDNTLLREATATTAFGFGPKSRNTRYWMYSRYGQPVHVSLPSACRARP
jgi:hypothetical protein